MPTLVVSPAVRLAHVSHLPALTLASRSLAERDHARARWYRRQLKIRSSSLPSSFVHLDVYPAPAGAAYVACPGALVAAVATVSDTAGAAGAACAAEAGADAGAERHPSKLAVQDVVAAGAVAGGGAAGGVSAACVPISSGTSCRGVALSVLAEDDLSNFTPPSARSAPLCLAFRLAPPAPLAEGWEGSAA